MMEKRLQQLFFALSFLALALVVIALWQASTPEWKTYQRQFNQLEAQGEPNAKARAALLEQPLEIHQIMLTGLGRVDRCTTCHLGVDDPTMKNAPEPFRYHAGLGPHVQPKFGCTVCHGGQGLATDKENAHGKAGSSEESLLAPEYVRATCGRCHDQGNVPSVPELTEGARLVETTGCRGCHKLNGIAPAIGPDLTGEADAHRTPEWLEQHFQNPAAVTKDSAMPNEHFNKEQVRALTFYMCSLSSAKMANYYLGVRLIPGAAQGRQLFAEKHCLGCHAIGGVGAKAGPDLKGVTGRRSVQSIDEQINNPQMTYPGTSMPDYGLGINARKSLIAFLGNATPEDAKSILSEKKPGLSSEQAAIESGRLEFMHFGCAGCHGGDLQGGTPNRNAQGGEVPALLHLDQDYTHDEVLNVVRKGRVPPLEKANGPVPPLYMPAWKQFISEEDIDRIVAYLYSKQEKEKADEAW